MPNLHHTPEVRSGQWSGPHDQISRHIAAASHCSIPLSSPWPLVSCSARVLHGNELGQLGHGAGHQVTFAGWPENCLELVKLNQTAERPALTPPPPQTPAGF